MRVLVTGGAGFIGSHLCEALLARGDTVVCLDNLDPFYDARVKRRNLSGMLDHERFTFIQGDIRDEEAVREAIRAHEVRRIVHLAARAGVQPSLSQALLYQDINVRGTLTLLEACRDSDVEQFVFGSSSSVYGGNTKVPFSEDDRLAGQISPYAASKRAAELFCYTHHHLTGLPVTCLRFFTVHGERMRPDLSIYLFAEMLRAGDTITIFGEPKRDFTYVADVVDGTLAALDNVLGFEIINLGDAQPVPIVDVIDLLARELELEAHTVPGAPRMGDPQVTFADISKAGRLLGYKPIVPLAEGLKRFVCWYREVAM